MKLKIDSLYKVLLYPKAVFRLNLKSYNLLLPILIITIISIGLSYVNSIFFAAQSLDNNNEYIRPIILLFSVFISSVSPFAAIIVVSIINYIALLVMRSYASFRKLFIVGIYSYIPLLISSLLNIVVSLFYGKPLGFTILSLNSLETDPKSLFSYFLNSFSLFGVWSLYIYTIGIITIFENKSFSNKKIIVITFINVLITILNAIWNYLSRAT
ncbi:YIP1 family protein [Paraliobacillus sp. JSM ZJ581]|uniref:YIP1 family protein n=1 Tax=Paraliobacillus sp. JSM ZJ581 TaxID=3342118 RepID=UPI0035A986D2